jgi:hypothetical protein
MYSHENKYSIVFQILLQLRNSIIYLTPKVTCAPTKCANFGAGWPGSFKILGNIDVYTTTHKQCKNSNYIFIISWHAET